MPQKRKTVYRELTREEAKKRVAKHKNRKAGGADRIVYYLMNLGGEGTLTMMIILSCHWIWQNEHAPKRWREGVVVNLFKKGDKADPIKLPRDNDINPSRAPEPFPILNPSNLPKTGFQL